MDDLDHILFILLSMVGSLVAYSIIIGTLTALQIWLEIRNEE